MKTLVVLLLLISSSLHAQMSPAYRHAEMKFITLQVLDMTSTIKAIHAGGYEGNPFLKSSVAHPWKFALVKTGIVLCATGGLRALHQDHPLLALIILQTVNMAYTGIVAHNYQIAFKIRL